MASLHPQCMTIRGFGVFTCPRARRRISALQKHGWILQGGKADTAHSTVHFLYLGFTWRAPQDLSAFLEENFLTFMHDRLFFFKPRPRYNNLKKCNDDMAMHMGILLVSVRTIAEGISNIFSRMYHSIQGKVMVSCTKMLFKYTIVYGFFKRLQFSQKTYAENGL